ncbi:MAG: phosphatase PAP2 family protein [Gammaproteobacteria bacterium]
MSIVNKLFSHSASGARTTAFVRAAVCGTIVLTAVSVVWIDRPLAHAVARWLPPSRRIPAVPDLLMPFVAIVSIAMLMIWVWTWSRGRSNSHIGHLAPLLTLGIPLSFGLKALTKWIYGRTETRMFLSTYHSCDFCHWLDGYGPYTGFPSGHMLVLTTLLVLVGAIYPRLRYYAAAILIALAFALILTSYHFLGDVLGGWLFGYWLALIILKTDAALRSATARRTPV